jgi:hypothetical protein
MRPVILAAFLSLAAPSQPQNSSDVAAVVQRATDYVTRYEEELGNLIGTEEYIQNSTWYGNDRSGNLKVAKRMRARLSSDFLIIQVGPEWNAVRKVNRLDGIKIKEIEPSLEEAFDNSAEANYKRVLNMKADSTRYNIGDVIREINLPTFALRVLRKSQVRRFAFERAGAGKVEGVQTWAVRFHERTEPTLVVGLNDRPLYSSGTLWIEPETGRVLRTEFMVDNPYAASRVKGRITVRYSEGKNLKMLLPSLMDELYESEFNTVDCQAFYSNFRPFEVDVKFEIHPPAQ